MAYLINGKQSSRDDVWQILQDSGWTNDENKEEIIDKVGKGDTFVFGTDRPGEGSMFTYLPQSLKNVTPTNSKTVIIRKADE